MIHVAVAVIENHKGEILISKRHDHLHQGGLWEYPGGKVEAGEDVRTALTREIEEELGIQVGAARPLIQIPHDYGDRHVLLDVYQVTDWRGEPHGREGQPIEWVARSALADYRFPAANRPITLAVQLPSTYVITPEPEQHSAFLSAVQRLVAGGCGLLQLRAKTLPEQALIALAQQVAEVCAGSKTRWLINQHIELAEQLGCGVHLTATQLKQLTERPLPSSQLVAASCHSAEELTQAEQLGVDFVVLSPVLATASHPEAQPLGWDVFADLAGSARMPVYALGGMMPNDVAQAQARGGQGVAGIGGYWPA